MIDDRINRLEAEMNNLRVSQERALAAQEQGHNHLQKMLVQLSTWLEQLATERTKSSAERFSGSRHPNLGQETHNRPLIPRLTKLEFPRSFPNLKLLTRPFDRCPAFMPLPSMRLLPDLGASPQHKSIPRCESSPWQEAIPQRVGSSLGARQAELGKVGSFLGARPLPGEVELDEVEGLDRPSSSGPMGFGKGKVDLVNSGPGQS
ncbi:hypothetical protein Drorol1_Dr00013077 [Drosera rotundifolia]